MAGSFKTKTDVGTGDEDGFPGKGPRWVCRSDKDLRVEKFGEAHHWYVLMRLINRDLPWRDDGALRPCDPRWREHSRQSIFIPSSEIDR